MKWLQRKNFTKDLLLCERRKYISPSVAYVIRYWRLISLRLFFFLSLAYTKIYLLRCFTNMFQTEMVKNGILGNHGNPLRAWLRAISL